MPVPLRVVGSNGYLSFARLTPRKWSPHFSPVPLRVVGSNGLEPSTSRLSGVCSNQLSYEPIFFNLKDFGGGKRDRTADPLLAGQVLYQLSYAPIGFF